MTLAKIHMTTAKAFAQAAPAIITNELPMRPAMAFFSLDGFACHIGNNDKISRTSRTTVERCDLEGSEGKTLFYPST